VGPRLIFERPATKPRQKKSTMEGKKKGKKERILRSGSTKFYITGSQQRRFCGTVRELVCCSPPPSFYTYTATLPIANILVCLTHKDVFPGICVIDNQGSAHMTLM
jgi:hypothetical protein